ncbi:CENPB DNA-binding domain-containing protein 1-like [Chiloscyllium plagiosum]|uniref:CENPB DNA-binding domain-containing protein 1-like n=1 Tax=Chiloscyllium plagiosum TaxID=36176 RepID=UPI001CB883CA|nr:CENPB DNA-binding domain-containing protein 1-like [Chiloscyllium plagiosum]
MNLKGIQETTLHAMRDNAERIKASCVSGTGLNASKSVRSRTKEHEEMVQLLNVWIEDQLKKQSGTTFLTKTIYEDLRKKVENPVDVPSVLVVAGLLELRTVLLFVT